MTEHKNIHSALAAAQSKMGKARKDATNPHFRSKYADLSSVMNACMPALSGEGIAVFQSVIESELGSVMRTTFAFGEQTIYGDVPIIIGKKDMQGLGSALTYARRYGLMGLAGIAPDDDDGNAAVQSGPAGQEEPRSWAQTIIDELPQEATDREKARAVCDALKAQWKRKKTTTQLENEWERRQSLIVGLFKERFSDMHEEICDAYETRAEEVKPKDELTEAHKGIAAE